MAELEHTDIQGIITRGFNEMTGAVYLLLEVTDVAPAKKYLRRLVDDREITPSKYGDPKYVPAFHSTRRIQLAFTYDGLQKLNIHDDILKTFPREFREGMTEPARSQLLGDLNRNNPDHWQWGKRNDHSIHVLVFLFAAGEREVATLADERIRAFEQNGFVVCRRLDTYGRFMEKYRSTKEHFGFRDGISFPEVEGNDNKRKTEEDEQTRNSATGLVKNGKAPFQPPIRAGEFILGYENEYDQYPDTPLVPGFRDPSNELPGYQPDTTFRDFGKNGSFVVFRQMQQFVDKFWNYAKENSKEIVIQARSEHEQTSLSVRKFESAIQLASKMVGRWPGGAPLVLAPKFDDPALQKANNFNFSDTDPHGYACPFGSHIRRANPRDQIFSGRTPSVSEQMVRKHQMIRRGRIYGQPLAESMDPMEIMTKQDDGQERGLHFICIVANIARQFEFVQSVWFFNPVFGNLHGEVDPMFGPRRQDEIFTNSFTCQGKPFNRTYEGLPEFTRMIGGAYFFLPGIKAIKYICT